MLYYILFWTILGFIIHFYIIFGTNLLTGGPAQNCCFLPVLGIRRKGISNGVQTEWNHRERDFWNEQDPWDLDPTSRHVTGGHEVGARPTLPGTSPTLVGPLLLHRRISSSYIYLRTPKRLDTEPKNLIPPPQLSVSMRSHLGACSGAPPEEGRRHGGLLHHHSISDEVWVVYLRPSGP